MLQILNNIYIIVIVKLIILIQDQQITSPHRAEMYCLVNEGTWKTEGELFSLISSKRFTEDAISPNGNILAFYI